MDVKRSANYKQSEVALLGLPEDLPVALGVALGVALVVALGLVALSPALGLIPLGLALVVVVSSALSRQHVPRLLGQRPDVCLTILHTHLPRNKSAPLHLHIAAATNPEDSLTPM